MKKMYGKVAAACLAAVLLVIGCGGKESSRQFRHTVFGTRGHQLRNSYHRWNRL